MNDDKKRAAAAPKSRSEISDKYKWRLEAMYPDDESWENEYKSLFDEAGGFSRFRGRLTESAVTLADALEERDRLWQAADRIYVYARMRRDEDNGVAKYQAMTDKAHSLLAKLSAALSFFTPELLSAPEERILGFLKDEPRLALYDFLLKEILREKAHVLSPAEENLLAELSEVLGATNDVFTMLNDADMKFGSIRDESGAEVELTHGNYIGFMESKDRNVRKAAFETMYKAYIGHVNTLASTYAYNTKTDVISARIRKYPSALDAALFGDDIPRSVYENLISEVHAALPSLYKYLGIRKRLLGLDELHMYDVYVPLAAADEEKLSFEEACEIIKKALSPLGGDYVKAVSDGIEAGWIDVYENSGKTSGAYSFGSYDSMPYILMNFQGKLKDVFTLIHEMGHSMHSFYTRKSQPFVYGGHSIFTAETVSTTNENLLIKYLLAEEDRKLAEDPSDRKALEKKRYLLNLYIEEFRTTVFRQTMFAEFEKFTHEELEKGGVLTAERLCEKYAELNRLYFGDAVVSDREISYEWARIPHFYNAFYVYKYATGYSAAAALSERILKGDGRDAYLEFLKTGESDHPIELLKRAGVDMSEPAPIRSAMKLFSELVERFESIA